MFNISFGATLKVDENLYKKIPENTPKGQVEGVIEEYKSFIANPKMLKLLGDDTIELSKSKMKGYCKGYSVDLKITPADGSTPYKGGIFTTKQDAKYFRFSELARQTFQYIFCNKLNRPNDFHRIWFEVTRAKKQPSLPEKLNPSVNNS